MSTISPSTDWFHRRRPPTSTDLKATYRRLVRMLVSDAQRRAAAPVTLPGHPNGNGVNHNGNGINQNPTAPDPSRFPTRPKKTWYAPRGHSGRARRGGAEPTPADAEGPYRYEELLRMDQRFKAAVERAIKNGGEHRQSAAMNGANASRPR
jgi:hypothetical protein